MPHAFILPSLLIGTFDSLRSSSSKRRSAEIDACNTMHCDLAWRATIIRWIDAATEIAGVISYGVGAANVQFGSRTSRHAVASIEAVASSSAVRPRHWRATNRAPFPRTSTAEPETDPGSSPATAERPVISVGADIGAWLGLTIGGAARAGEASGCTTTVAKRPALMA